MESFQQPIENEVGLSRTEKVERAGEKIRTIFTERMNPSIILERIGANPYFRDIEQTNG
jgi:hypothetical protein